MLAFWIYCASPLNYRFFECNYGTQGTPLDKMFGTFRDKLKESGTSYRGGSEEKVDHYVDNMTRADQNRTDTT